jgi:soluble lytic murein transglycosylase
MKALAPLLAAAALASLAFAQDPGSEPAPQTQTGNAPSEAQLSPPPDAEKVLLPPGFIEVVNPAFPTAAPPAPVVQRGRSYTPEELAPYFAQSPLREAKDAFDRGLYAKARTLLRDQGDSNPVRYLRALAALRAGDDAFAAPEMAALAKAYPPMRDRCLTHAGLAYEGLGRFEEAAQHLAEVPVGSRLYPDARLGLARVLKRKKDLDGALAALAPLAGRNAPGWGRNVGAEALLASADLAAAKKERAQEREYLWKLWAQHPLTPMAKLAEKRLGTKEKPSLETQVDRAEALIEAHRNKQGMAVLEPLLPKLKLPEPLACRAHFNFGKALRKERQHTRAIASLDPVVTLCTDPELKPRALYVLGSSRSIVDQEAGPQTYEQLAREFPTHSFADDGLFYAADLYLKTNRPEQARARLEELARLYPQGDFLGEALFKDFWILRGQGKTEAALRVLDQIEQRFAKADETYDVERAKYWRARMLQTGGKAEEAARLFERLAVEHPATYYGLMARSQLAAHEPARLERIADQLVFGAERQEPWPLFAGPLGEDVHFQAGVELLRLGFPEAVSSELLAANRSGQSAESLRLLVHLLALAGDERSAHAVARLSLRSDLSGRITPKSRPVWEVAYPNAFRPLIEKHTETAKLEADLLQALMREESALDPKALSWAGALGLTQLMPSTAQAVARELKLGRMKPERLLEPELNIRLGAWYLGSLVKRFDGNKPFAIASYNAGPGAVNRWRADKSGLALDEWVEEIPISETRGYVKRVLRSYNTYQLLYGRTAPVTAPPSAKL